jgi:hypothetical protein
MADDLNELLAIKIFPRNLTARATNVVRGNAAISRPESGVDNCYPGLEFDQRNLDKRFFPSLRFEYHRGEGAVLVEVAPDSEATRLGLSLPRAAGELYLWALRGSFSVAEPASIFMGGLNGLEVWRRVHDLRPGPLAIILGPRPGFSAAEPSGQLESALQQAMQMQTGAVIGDDERLFVLFGSRAAYLQDGVIGDEFAPGELTATLCAPWQYDFRDCGCFYWASSKPDIVSSEDGQQPYLNFQRKDRTAIPGSAAAVLAQWERDSELDYPELVQGAWNELPVVLNNREVTRFVSPKLADVPLLSREVVIEELRYLAEVEHALCVEYLYAHYSLNAPFNSSGSDPVTTRISEAAQEVFQIAVDEMRHLRWVNECLAMLRGRVALGRASRIGRQLERVFALRPLGAEQLQWFIDVEAPSQQMGEQIDGMYVRLLTSIVRQPEQFPERDRLLPMIKTIIDEGQEHWARFVAVRTHLQGIDEARFLRSLGPSRDEIQSRLLRLSDENYRVLLASLSVTLEFGDRAGGLLLEQSRRAMFNLHEINHLLASQGVAPQFALPPPAPVFQSRATAVDFLDEVHGSHSAAIATLAEIPSEAGLAERQRRAVDALVTGLKQLVRHP